MHKNGKLVKCPRRMSVAQAWAIDQLEQSQRHATPVTDGVSYGVITRVGK